MTSQDFPYEMTRAGVVLRPDADAPYEVEGVLNPAAAWSPDGHLVLFPRVVAQGNWLGMATSWTRRVSRFPRRSPRANITPRTAASRCVWSARVEGLVAPVSQVFQSGGGFGIGTCSQLDDKVCVVGWTDVGECGDLGMRVDHEATHEHPSVWWRKVWLSTCRVASPASGLNGRIGSPLP